MGKLVERFNRDGLKALQTQPSHGHRVTYTAEQRALVLEEFRRPPDRDMDGTGNMVVDDVAAGRAQTTGDGSDQSRHA